MIKTLVEHGNSWALVIARRILELLRATPESKFEVLTDGGSLVLTPVRKKADEKKFQEALDMVHKCFGGAVKDFLNSDQVLKVHRSLIERYGGSDGIRDVGLLESAIAQPQPMFGGAFLHSDILEMAAAYLFHLVRNHPFIDGNKRIGAAAAIVFFALKDVLLEADENGSVVPTLSAGSGLAR